jgi:hypothetical protein
VTEVEKVEDMEKVQQQAVPKGDVVMKEAGEGVGVVQMR